MNSRTFAPLSLVSLLLLVGLAALPEAGATVYKPGLSEGIFMKYEVEHSPEIESVMFLVTSVTNETVTLNVTTTLTNGTFVNDTLSLSFGEIVLKNSSKIIVPTNTTEGWVSTFGMNDVALGDEYLQIIMRIDNQSRFNQVTYLFEDPLDLSNSSFIQLEIAPDGVDSKDRYFLSLEDEDGRAASFEFGVSGVPDPRTQDFLLWDTVLISLPDQSEASDVIDLSRIKAVAVLYDGRSDRALRLREIRGVEVEDVGHIYQFYSFYPIYLVIATNLVEGDQIYPDLPLVIEEESEIVHQDVQRMVLKGTIVFLSDGQAFVGTEYSWDAETGILVESSFTARGTREMMLVETNAWSPQNLLTYLATVITATIPMAVASFWNEGGGIAVGIALAWIGGFAAVTIYDKSKRGELGGFKQWLPFLYILIIASVVSFLLLRVLPLAF